MQVLQDPSALINDAKILGRSPLDGSELPPVDVTAPEDVQRAVAKAREAQLRWAEHPVRDRARRLKSLRGEMLARADAWAKLMREELGKSAIESYTSEIIPSGDLFSYWAAVGPKLLAPRAQGLNPINFPAKSGVIELHPKGVVAVIAPWNFPVSLPLRNLCPALVAGNAVVFKPSEYAPRIGAEVASLFEGLGVPGLVTLVQGGAETGARLVESGVDHVSFTGSNAAGRKVAAECADRFVSYSLELGGKDAAIVCADADLERTADGLVWGSFMNGGQNCASIERIYAVEAIATKLCELLVAKTKALKLGGPDVEDFDVCPLVRPAGLETVERHVKDAIDNGATLRAGGKATGVGRFFEPTILTDVDDDMAVMTEETFGPVLALATVGDEEEAIARANQSVYGLTASIWTRDLDRGKKLAGRLDTGVVTINNHAFTGAVPHAPWHGRRHSGGGITNSPHALADLVVPKYVLVDRNRSRELHWYPHTPTFRRLATGLAGLMARGGNKLASLLQVLKSFPRRWKTD